MLPQISKTMDAETVFAYAVLTDDFNPIHIDPAFAATTPMGRCIAHGMLSLNLIWQWAAPLLSAESRSQAELDVRFTKPVFVGDHVTAHGVLQDDADDDSRAVFAVTVANDAGEPVIAGVLRLPPAAIDAYRASCGGQLELLEGLQ